jgi:tRNA pseudouridine55 synthase
MSDYNFADGEVLLINKPLTWTSFDVVRKIRNCIKIKKVGHAGTLDPLATGLLVVCTGKKTKTIDLIQATDKEYTGTITVGGTTPSYDKETEVNETFPTEHITDELIYETAKSFLGANEQIPPAHSAIKINGERVYKKARRGEEVIMKPRLITINEFEITAINLPEISFRIACTKGTYIRSIAFDFGQRLNSGGYLSSLVRTKIGELKIEDAMTIDEFMDKTEV